VKSLFGNGWENAINTPIALEAEEVKSDFDSRRVSIIQMTNGAISLRKLGKTMCQGLCQKWEGKLLALAGH
jgi:hypothetical protein